jgi:hypothetical protein
LRRRLTSAFEENSAERPILLRLIHSGILSRRLALPVVWLGWGRNQLKPGQEWIDQARNGANIFRWVCEPDLLGVLYLESFR